MTRLGWPGAAVLIVVGLLAWFLIAPLLSPPLLATIVVVIGVLLVVVGAIELVASLVGAHRRV